MTRDVALSTITALHRGESPTPAAVPGAPYLLAVRVSQGGCWIASVTEVARRDATISSVVVLDDRPKRVEDSRHQRRWADWLHWANVLQFLNGEERTADFVTTTTAWDPVVLLPGAATPSTRAVFAPVVTSASASADAPLPAAWARLLRMASSPAVESLITALGRDGRIAVPAIGLDVGDDNEWLVELAWQDDQTRLAAVTDNDERRDAWLSGHGWHVVHIADDTALEQIVAYLDGGIQ